MPGNRPTSWDDYVPYDGNEQVTPMTVFEPEPRVTGVLDAQGRMIAYPGIRRIGFLQGGE